MEGNDVKELKELVEFLKANDIAEFDMEREDLKVRLKFANAIVHPAPIYNVASQAAAPVPAINAGAAPTVAAPTAQPSSAPAAPAADPDAGLHIIKSPIVGTFYASPSPDAAPFVKAGDKVESGTVLCIVEAMKLMNEIESDIAGEIVRIIPTVGQPVEYGQPLFAIKAR